MSSIFDIFSDQPAKDAAAAQIAGINSGLNALTGDFQTGLGGLSSNYGTGLSTLTGNFGAGLAGLASNYGTGLNALTGNFGQAANALNTNYTSALQPYLTNYNNANAGVNQLGNVLGLNGPAGNANALSTLENTPGYQFQLQQGNNAINAQAAATGQLASGNTALALSNYNQGLAGTTYNNYVQQLQPFLGASNAAASGIGGIYTGLGSNLSGLYQNLGGAANNTYQGIGNAANTTAQGIGLAGNNTYQGIGNATNSTYQNLGNAAYGANTSIGNANANADLAAYNASGNFWNMLGGLGGMKTSGGGTVGGNLLGSFGGGGGVAGAMGPSSVGGAALSGGGSGLLGGLGSIFSMFSDERLKEDIEPVGKLYDGTNVYSYRYKGDHVPRIGLMAQEVEERRPDAVIEIGGYKAVDYGKATRYAADLARFLEAA